MAEVLITLGVIGVVAALTLPAVMTKVEKIVLKNQFKKVYSVYTTALQKTIFDMGGTPRCFYNIVPGADNWDFFEQSDCVEFYQKLLENMKVIKTCNGNALAGGCVPVYSTYTENSGCAGYSEDRINNKNYAAILQDGSVFIAYDSFDGLAMPLFAVDVNGKKGPNTPGEDLFNLSILKEGNKYYFNPKINGCLTNTSINVKDFLY